MYCDQCGTRLSAANARCPSCDTVPPVPPSGFLRSGPSPGGHDPEVADPSPEPLWEHPDNGDPAVPAAPPIPRRQPERPEPGRRHERRVQRPPRRGPAGLVNNLFGNGVALFAAWFNMPVAVFLAAIGAIFGGVGGLLSGSIAGPGVLGQFDAIFTWVLPMPVSMSDLLPNTAIQIGGMIGAVMGAVSGAAKMLYFALLLPYSTMWWDDSVLPFGLVLGQIVAGVGVAALYVLYCRAAEPARLRITGARRPSRREADFLEPMIARAAARMGLDRAPELLIDDNREPNAYAGIRHIVVNRGLLEALRYDTEAISGVIAHEVAHYKHGDALSLAWNRGIAWPLFLLHEVSYRAQASALYWSIFLALVRILLWSVTVTIRFLVIPVSARHWRRTELRADDEARRAGYGPGLYSALTRLGASFDGARNGWDHSVLATHPPTELRLDRLEEAGDRRSLLDGLPGATPGVPERTESQLLKD